MKKSTTKLIAMLLLVVMAASLVSCGSKDSDTSSTSESTQTSSSGAGTEETSTTAESSEPVKMVIWTANLVNKTDQKRPQEEWTLTKVIKKFQEKHPNVEIEIVVEPDELQAHQSFKAAALAHNAPDMANFWAGYYITGLKDVLYPLDGKVPQEDLDVLQGWDYFRVGLEPSGTLVGYPWGTLDYNAIVYNKKLINAAGLDFETNPPRTIEEFEKACEKIKATGVIPLVTDEGTGFPRLFYLLSNYWWVQQSGYETLAKLNNMEMKFAEDEGLISALTTYQSLFKKGYINEDAVSSSSSDERFYNGKAAMYVTSVGEEMYEALGEDLGLINPPDMPNAKITNANIGGPSQGIVISQDCKYPDIAIEFCHYLNSKEVYLMYLDWWKFIPIRKDITAEEAGFTGSPVWEKCFEIAKTSIEYVDNCVDSTAINELVALAPLVMLGKMTPQEAAESADKKMAEAYQ